MLEPGEGFAHESVVPTLGIAYDAVVDNGLAAFEDEIELEELHDLVSAEQSLEINVFVVFVSN